MKKILEFKKEYNALLARTKKAEIYFDDKTVSEDQKEQMRPLYMDILKQMDSLLMKIVFYSGDEILSGFDLDKTQGG